MTMEIMEMYIPKGVKKNLPAIFILVVSSEIDSQKREAVWKEKCCAADQY